MLRNDYAEKIIEIMKEDKGQPVLPSKEEILTFTLGVENIVRFGK